LYDSLTTLQCHIVKVTARCGINHKTTECTELVQRRNIILIEHKVSVIYMIILGVLLNIKNSSTDLRRMHLRIFLMLL
jgi:hypothetical protein